MLQTPDEEDIPLRHRPLPSVDFALLPHELRAIRMQRLAIGGAAVGLVAIVVGLAYGKAMWAHLHGTPPEHSWDGAESGPNSTTTLAATNTPDGISARRTGSAADRRTPPVVSALPRPSS